MTPRFTVTMPGRVADQVRAVLASAADPTPVMSAYRAALRALATDPVGYGEARDNYPAMGVRTRIACEGPLVIRFGVHEAARLVWIQSFRLSRPDRR